MRLWLVFCRGNRPQIEIANDVGITQQAYSAIENGSRNPSVDIAKKIAEVLEFDWTKFYENEIQDKIG